MEFDLTEGDSVAELVDRVLGRDEGWLDYYGREVKLAELDRDQLIRTQQAEPVMIAATLSEAKYAAAMWSGDPAIARLELEKTIDKTATSDAKLSGWHSVWLGAAYELEGDRDAAYRAYSVAMRRLTRSMTLPSLPRLAVSELNPHELSSFGVSLQELLSYPQGAKFENELGKLTDTLEYIDSGTTSQAEAGVRQLGELLGFIAIRPDNDEGTGPDVLWLDESQMCMLGFELKTEKDDPATYFKKDIRQGHDHLEWMRKNRANYISLGLLYIGPDGSVDAKANPSEKMGLCLRQSVVALRDRVLALIEDLRFKTPIERFAHIPKVTEEKQWNIKILIGELWDKNLIKS